MDPPRIEWFRSEDLILGFCGMHGHLGVYRRWIDREGPWQFCPTGTIAWDRHHQWVYLQGRADPCALPEGMPPLPEAFPPPEDLWVLDPPEPATPNVLPGSAVYDRVQSAPGRRLRVFVVLREDRYESALGDGIFRDFDSAHLERAEAESRIAAESSSGEAQACIGYTFYLREAWLEVADGKVRLAPGRSERSPFDRFTAQEICDDLARGDPGRVGGRPGGST